MKKLKKIDGIISLSDADFNNECIACGPEIVTDGKRVFRIVAMVEMIWFIEAEPQNAKFWPNLIYSIHQN
jgi:hypothetical protein